MKVREKIESDHQKRGKRRRGEKIWRGVWSEEGSNMFRRKLGEVKIRKREIREEWEQMERRVKRAVKETELELEREKKKESWHEECAEKKKMVRGELRECRRKGGGEEYKRKKKEYRELCEKKKKEENDNWKKQVAEAKRESEIWELLNRERKKKRRRINKTIGKKEWKEYYM